jgi:hypothetical protein
MIYRARVACLPVPNLTRSAGINIMSDFCCEGAKTGQVENTGPDGRHFAFVSTAEAAGCANASASCVPTRLE